MVVGYAVHKPSCCQFFRTCLELAEICREVGLPPGVLNILTGLGTEAGAPLAAHPHVDKVSIQLSDVASGQILLNDILRFHSRSIANMFLADCIHWKHSNRDQNNDICSSDGQGIQLFYTLHLPALFHAPCLIYVPNHHITRNILTACFNGAWWEEPNYCF